MKIILTILVAAALFTSCKKDKVIAPVVPKDYKGQWNNVSKSPAGPLDFFSMKLVLDANGGGTSDFIYLANNQSYQQTNLSWHKIAGDSVVITLNIPAYPNETWELRGLNNDNNTQLTADYFSTPNNNPSDKKKYGTMAFTH